jgi:hypothetical protein
LQISLDLSKEFLVYKVQKTGKGGISVKIVADSVSEGKVRITTFELEYHRYIHGELMTHRLFSRNAMSSRAVPVKSMIKQVMAFPATPIHWGKNKAGMQAEEESNNFLVPPMGYCNGESITREDGWVLAKETAVEMAMMFDGAGYHKQIVNRLLEPFQMMKVVLTATEFENFFWLRCDPDAQPEIKEMAELMYTCMEISRPTVIGVGEWHTPYVKQVPHPLGIDYYAEGTTPYDTAHSGENRLTVEQAISISASCCAQVSYRNIDNTFDKAMQVYSRLGVGGNKIHASPFEHVATPMKNQSKRLEPCMWVKGITHMTRDGDYWSGNFRGWIQHRQQLDNHTKW